jgi:hypothetical protein
MAKMKTAKILGVNAWPDKKYDCGLDHRSIKINSTVWNTFDDATMKEFKDAVFDHYRAVGAHFKAMGLTAYPHIVMETDEKKLAEVNELLNYTTKVFSKEREKLISKDEDGNVLIGQTMHALGLAWSYFPHWTTVQCNEMRTPQETFDSDEIFRKVINKRIMWHKDGVKVEGSGIGTMMTDNGIRKSIKMFTGTQAVSNFRPTAAAAIYEELLPTGGVTWDMSMGWGGRMLGALACEKVTKYIGCDPETRTFAGLERLRDDIKRLVPNRKLEIEIHCCGSETAQIKAALPESGVDLCFTSPPYFDCEKYSDEPTQSWVQFKTTDAWLTDFMGSTMDNCWHALKSGGIMAINIADVSTYEGMEGYIVDLAERKGWIYERKIRLTLSAVVGGTKYRECEKCQILTAEAAKAESVLPDYPGNWKKCSKHKYKYEPIFVFRKP